MLGVKPTMLIVDDDLAILHSFRRIFERKGYSVAVACRGMEAKEKLSSNCYDVALIDLCLPDMEGTELFPFIQQSSSKTLKIIITGKTYLQNSIKGADFFIAKPVDPNLLLGILDTKLKAHNIET